MEVEAATVIKRHLRVFAARQLGDLLALAVAEFPGLSSRFIDSLGAELGLLRTMSCSVTAKIRSNYRVVFEPAPNRNQTRVLHE